MSWQEEEAPRRRIWLITLADLALLLVGFFVLVQASGRMDPKALAAGIRSGFAGKADTAAAPAMALELATVNGFAPGSARPANADDAIQWAREAARDPRMLLKITGESDGSAQDVDPATGSGAILAADRARAVAARLVAAGAVSPDRIAIATAQGRRRAVLTLGYDGGRP